jgi:hypothetical protein
MIPKEVAHIVTDLTEDEVIQAGRDRIPGTSGVGVASEVTGNRVLMQSGHADDYIRELIRLSKEDPNVEAVHGDSIIVNSEFDIMKLHELMKQDQKEFKGVSLSPTAGPNRAQRRKYAKDRRRGKV